jgi:acyl-CoA synthetase (AMP-forming)/AMP-acid ligase II/thioesterase domain-containing protein
MSVSPASAALAVSAPTSQHSRQTSIVEFLLRAAQSYPSHGMSLLSGPRADGTPVLSHLVLLDEAQRILGGLGQYHRAPGTRVALLLEHAGDFIPAFWACILGGYVPCPLAPLHNDPERWARHLSHVYQLLDRPLVVTTDKLGRELQISDPIFLEYLRASAPASSIFEARSEDPAVLVLTSGSTGHSKAVVLTHGNLVASMSAKNTYHQLTAADMSLNWISFDHVAALLEAHLLPLSVGAGQIHVDPASILADPLLFLRLIDRHRVSMTFAPNFLFGQINAAVTASISGASREPLALNLSCVRHIISGGEAIVTETGRRFLQLLEPFALARSALWPAFGMTETCAGSVYSQEFPDRDQGQEFASLGLPVEGLHMRVADENGAFLHSGESGELQLRGPMVFKRYHNNEEATRAAFTQDGWFRTGDLGRIEDGRLRLVGRSKDCIIVSGVNYFSHELETAIEPLTGIERSFVAVFPIRPSGVDTEQLVVAFAPTAAFEDEDSLSRVMTGIRNTTVLLWGFRPSLVLPLPNEEFPKTSLGKIQRGLLRKRLEAGELSAHVQRARKLIARSSAEYVPPANDCESAVAEIFSTVFNLDSATVGAGSNFFDLGGTSLDIVKLKQSVEQHFGLDDLAVVTILQNPTVRALAARATRAAGHASGFYDPVVQLQSTGSKTPLFCIHAGSGEVLVFVSLASYFANDRPFYALRARGLEPGENYFDSFQEMVSLYVQAIRERQPRGPYALAGYSFGGAVAFEIAKVLDSEGERVAFLGSIDGPARIRHPKGELDSIDTAVLLAFFFSLLDREQMETLPSLLRAGSEDPYKRILQLAPAERIRELDLDGPKFKAWAALSQSLVNVGQRYEPSGSVQNMTVFYAQPLWGSKEAWLKDHLKPWDRFTRTANRYVEVAGEHHTLLAPRHVASFQAILRSEIDRAFAATQENLQ